MNSSINSYIYIYIYISQPEFLDEFIYMNSDVWFHYISFDHEFRYEFIYMNSNKISWSWIHMLHFMTYEFRYAFMYMKNTVKSYMKSGVPRFQMRVQDCPTVILELLMLNIKTRHDVPEFLNANLWSIHIIALDITIDWSWKIFSFCTIFAQCSSSSSLTSEKWGPRTWNLGEIFEIEISTTVEVDDVYKGRLPKRSYGYLRRPWRRDSVLEPLAAPGSRCPVWEPLLCRGCPSCNLREREIGQAVRANSWKQKIKLEKITPLRCHGKLSGSDGRSAGRQEGDCGHWCYSASCGVRWPWRTVQDTERRPWGLVLSWVTAGNWTQWEAVIKQR